MNNSIQLVFTTREVEQKITYAKLFSDCCKKGDFIEAESHLKSYINFVNILPIDERQLATAYDTAIQFYEYIGKPSKVKKYTNKLKALAQKYYDDYEAMTSQIEQIYYNNPLDKSIYQSLNLHCQAAAMLHCQKTFWQCLNEYCFLALRSGGNTKPELQKYTETLTTYIEMDYTESLYKFNVSESVLNYCLLSTVFFKENEKAEKLKKDILRNTQSKRKTPLLEKIVDCIIGMIERHQLPGAKQLIHIADECTATDDKYLLLCAVCILFPNEYDTIQQLAAAIDFFSITLGYEKHLPLYVKTVVLISKDNVNNNILFKLDEVENDCTKVNKDYANIINNLKESEFPKLKKHYEDIYGIKHETLLRTNGVSLSPKKHKTALLLAIFGGLLGLHDLYLGYFFRFLVKTGIFICIACLFFSDITVFLSIAFFVFIFIMILWYILDISFLIAGKKYDSKNRIVRR